MGDTPRRDEYFNNRAWGTAEFASSMIYGQVLSGFPVTYTEDELNELIRRWGAKKDRKDMLGFVNIAINELNVRHARQTVGTGQMTFFSVNSLLHVSRQMLTEARQSARSSSRSATISVGVAVAATIVSGVSLWFASRSDTSSTNWKHEQAQWVQNAETHQSYLNQALIRRIDALTEEVRKLREQIPPAKN